MLARASLRRDRFRRTAFQPRMCSMTIVVTLPQEALELAKQAGFTYRTQNPAEQRRFLDRVLSNCTFDRGSLCPTYSQPFDLFVRGNKTGNWRRGWDSNAISSCRICNLQIPGCQDCRGCQRRRGALPDFTRRAFGWYGPLAALTHVVHCSCGNAGYRVTGHCSLHHSGRPTPSARFE